LKGGGPVPAAFADFYRLYIGMAARPWRWGSQAGNLGKRHGKARNRQDPSGLDRRHRLLLCDEEEPSEHHREVRVPKYDPVVRKHVEFKEAKIK
jgi:hypothetical protein